MSYVAIIPAAGTSARFKKDKLTLKLNNEYLIKHTLYNFQEDKNCSKIILVVPTNKFDFYKKMFCLVNKILVVTGGSTRSESVYKGLQYALKSDYVLVHDAARPYVEPELITNVYQALVNEDSDGVIPVIDETDSIIHLDPESSSFTYVDRSHFKRVQTPQGFKTNILVHAYQQKTSFTHSDEASLVLTQLPNAQIQTIPGNPSNIKITTPEDVPQVVYDQE